MASKVALNKRIEQANNILIEELSLDLNQLGGIRKNDPLHVQADLMERIAEGVALRSKYIDSLNKKISKLEKNVTELEKQLAGKEANAVQEKE